MDDHEKTLMSQLARLAETLPDDSEMAWGDIARVVSEKRKSLGWSQRDLAVAAGCSRATVARLESGHVVLSATVLKIVAALSAGVAYMAAPDSAGDPDRDYDYDVYDDDDDVDGDDYVMDPEPDHIIDDDYELY